MFQILTWGREATSHSLSQCWPRSLLPYGHNEVNIDTSWSLQWRHNERGGVSNHQPHDCLFNRLIRRRSKKTSKLRIRSLCVGNSPMTGEFPEKRAGNPENISIWWRHHVKCRPEGFTECLYLSAICMESVPPCQWSKGLALTHDTGGQKRSIIQSHSKSIRIDIAAATFQRAGLLSW